MDITIFLSGVFGLIILSAFLKLCLNISEMKQDQKKLLYILRKKYGEDVDLTDWEDS